MRKLGLVGGMGPESTIPYYHDIVYGVQKKIGQKIFPSLTIESVDVFHVLNLCSDKDYEGMTEYLMSAINNLIQSGADFVALSANTPHIIFDSLQARSSVPMISIVESACLEAQRIGYKKIGLLGTEFTMKEDFFKAPFIKSGIDIAVPSLTEMDLVNDKISSELELGVVKKETLSSFQEIIERMKQEDEIEAIVLGCTELPLLLNDEVSSVPCLDTMKIHIDALINEILN